MSAVVIDTNVILVAKGISPQAWTSCVTECQERLDQIIEGQEKIVIDDNWIILSEYDTYLEDDDLTTDHRISEHFLEWFIRNYDNPEQCVQVPITRDENGFEELPDAFQDFDSDDKKFIAVAVVYENMHKQQAVLLQSVDSQWYGKQEVFNENGLIVEFICEENIRDLYARREERRQSRTE